MNRHRKWRILNVRYLGIGIVLLFLFGVCGNTLVARAGYFDYDDVVVIVNDASATSTTIANYFQTARSIPDLQMIHINTPETEKISRATFTTDIRTPVENYLLANNLASTTNYIVTTKGVPLTINNDGSTPNTASVDQELMLILGDNSSYIGNVGSHANPYHNASVRFSRTAYDMYLVTRLTGYTIQDVEDLIDRSDNATTTDSGTFVLDVDPHRDSPGYQGINDGMRTAATLLSAKGYSVTLDETDTYLTGQTNVAGYFSWGSNDCCDTNHGIPGNTWVNGAIAETAVSSSGRSFTIGTTYGQSLIADLIAEGVTGVSGYVNEPYASAIEYADILFDRYTTGYNLADSFGMGENYIGWKQVVVGDPKTVIVKTLLPFSLTSPVDNAIVSSVNPTFVWEDAASYYALSKYQLYIDGVLNVDNLTATSTTPSSDLSAGTHTWYIKAIDIANNIATSTTYTINVIPGYNAGSHTFYVDNVLGDDANPGTQAAPYATISKAAGIAQAGDTITVVKNANQPYREQVTFTNSGASGAYITIQGVDENSEPEIWGSEDESGGWSSYGGGNANTYQKTVSETPATFAAGPSISNLNRKTKGASQDTLGAGEWYFASGTLYYRLATGEDINTLHIEAGARSYGFAADSYISYRNLSVRYVNTAGIVVANNSIAENINVVGCGVTGINVSGSSPTVRYSTSYDNAQYGVYILATTPNVSNITTYGNGVNGVYTVVTADNTLLRNVISAGNDSYSFAFLLFNPISNFTASHNNWDLTGDATWPTYEGTNNQASTSPLFVDAANGDFTLQQFSPDIDTGIDVGLTTDIIGNPIYGTPDIGAYEYQPPYVMGTDSPSTDGSLRIYADGKYRYTAATSTADIADLTVTPVGGFGTGDYAEYLDLSITDWQTSGTYAKSWTESSNYATTTVHTIGDLAPDTYYLVSVDGVNYVSTQTDGGGQLTFNYSGGYSSHTFTIEEDTSVSAATLSGPDDDTIVPNSGNLDFSWSSGSPDVASYELYIDGELYGDTMASTTNSVSVSVDNFNCGQHDWYIKTTDTAGNVSNSSIHTVSRICGGGGIFSGSLPEVNYVAPPSTDTDDTQREPNITDVVPVVNEPQTLLASSSMPSIVSPDLNASSTPQRKENSNIDLSSGDVDSVAIKKIKTMIVELQMQVISLLMQVQAILQKQLSV